MEVSEERISEQEIQLKICVTKPLFQLQSLDEFNLNKKMKTCLTKQFCIKKKDENPDSSLLRVKEKYIKKKSWL